MASRPLRAPAPNESAAILHSFTNHLLYSLAKDQYSATARDRFLSLALTVRDRLIERWIATQQRYYRRDAKRVYYLSAEFLMGRALLSNLLNLGLYETARESMRMIGLDIADLLEQEGDAGLGNGGLGRLAACFLDSMATLDIPGYGYGIRYEFGMFDQEIKDGYQFERPDEWLRFPNPWETPRPEYSINIGFGGRTEDYHDDRGRLKIRWIPAETVVGMAYDTPIAGYNNNTVNTLRLWRGRGGARYSSPPLHHAAAVAGAGQRRFRSHRLQRRRLRKSGDRQDPLGDDFQGLVSERREDVRQGAAAAAAVLLRRRLAPRHRQAAPGGTSLAGQLRREDGHPAQRHASGGGHPRADADLRRRARSALGKGLGPHRRHLRVHESHAPLGGARDLAGGPVREPPPPTPDDHLRDQPALLAPGDQPLSVRRAPPRPHVAHRRGTPRRPAFAPHPDGVPRGGRIALGERSRRAAHEAPRAAPPARLPRDVPGTLQQQDERRHAPALAPAGESPPRRRDHGSHRRCLARRSGRATPARAARRGRVVPPGSPRHQAAQQGRPRRGHREGDEPGDRSRLSVRRPGEAAARVQAAAPECIAHRRALSADQEGPRDRDGPPHLRLRRQGGARVRGGEDDHQAHQLGGRGGERRPAGGGEAQGGLPPELPGIARGTDLPWQRPLRADLHRR